MRWAGRSNWLVREAGEVSEVSLMVFPTAVDRRSTPSAQADRQDPLPMFRCPGLMADEPVSFAICPLFPPVTSSASIRISPR